MKVRKYRHPVYLLEIILGIVWQVFAVFGPKITILVIQPVLLVTSFRAESEMSEWGAKAYGKKSFFPLLSLPRAQLINFGDVLHKGKIPQVN